MRRVLADHVSGLCAAALLLFLLAASVAPVSPIHAQSNSSSVVPGQILVRFADDAESAARDAVFADYPVIRETAGLYRLAVPVGSEVNVALALNNHPAVANAAPVLLQTPVLQPARAAPATPSERSVPESSNTSTALVESPLTSAAPEQTLSYRVDRFWLSDRVNGEALVGGAAAGKCGGPRINAFPGMIFYSNFTYSGGLQTARLQIYDLGFLNRTRLVDDIPNITRFQTVNGTTTYKIQMNYVDRLPVGCYQVVLQFDDGSGTWTPPYGIIQPFQIVTAPGDDLFRQGDLWHLDHTRSFDEGSRIADIKATGAWNITTGANTLIAIIGSGVDYTLPELSDAIYTNTLEIQGNGIDDDHSGKVDDIRGWNFFANNADPMDDFGLDTFLASLISAKARSPLGSNGGTVGINWGARILPVKVLGMRNGGLQPSTDQSIIEALAYARKMGARVILVTFAFNLDNPDDATRLFREQYRDQVARAYAEGALIITPVTVGNDNDQTLPLYPARFGDTVLAVTATDQDDRWWSTAAYHQYVDLAAPGLPSMWGVTIPYPAWMGGSFVNNPFEAPGDTYFAAAQVAGTVGLIWSVNPGLTPPEVQQILFATANKVNPEQSPYYDGRNDYLGAGRVNAEAALWETPHDMRGAFTWTSLPTTATRQCVRVINRRTSAITWTLKPPAGFEDWIEIRGPYAVVSGLYTENRYGDTPSYADACILLARRPADPATYRASMKLTATSTLPKVVAGSRTVDLFLPELYGVQPSRNFVPIVMQTTPSVSHR